MRKTNVTKTLIITIFLIGFSLVYSNKVQASEATLSVSNCNVGENFKVTVNIPNDVVAYEGSLSITYSNGNKVSLDKLIASPSPSPSNLSYAGNYTGTFKADVSGQATITVSNLKLYNVASYDNLTSINADFSPVNSTRTLMQTITISNPTPDPEPTPEPTPSQNQEPNGQTSNDKPATNSSNSNSSNTTETNTSPAPVTLNFKDTNEKMYTTRRVNVRQSYGTDSNIIQTLSADTEVTRTGISSGTKDGYSWSRVSYNGITGYLITGALTSEAPVKEEPKTDEKENPQENIDDKKNEELEKENQEKDENIVDEENKEQVDEENKITVETISEELGAIPEVGVNIMPCMFLGSVVTCLIIMFVTKRGCENYLAKEKNN